VFPGFLDGSVPILSLAAGFERGSSFDEVANGAAHGSAVTDDEDSHRSPRETTWLKKILVFTA
jgi:hypothetical protein